MFELIDVAVKKNERCVLSGISTTLSEKRIGIVGLNGSGKSTFAKLLNGLEVPTSGTIRYNTSSDIKNRRRDVGFVFQNPDNQIIYPIVAEDLKFGLKNLHLPNSEIQTRIEEVTNRFRIEHLLDRCVHQLSEGNRQMVALAGVLVMKPKVIVFDEPTALLDLKNKHRLLDAINQLDQQIIIISHDLDVVRPCSRLLHIEDGRIKREGSAFEIIKNYVSDYS